MAWSRTAAGLMAFGFVIAFVVLGVALSALSIIQYRRSVVTLRPVKVPPGYWVNLSVFLPHHRLRED